MHKSLSFWQGFKRGTRFPEEFLPAAPLQVDDCCQESYLLGQATGLKYRVMVIKLKSRLLWLAPLAAALWLLLDKIAHLFGICIGG